jgi:hypothetical protein
VSIHHFPTSEKVLALSLLVLRVLADYHDLAMSLDDLALLANRLY